MVMTGKLVIMRVMVSQEGADNDAEQNGIGG